METSLGRKLRLWLWVVFTAALAGGLVLIEVSLHRRSVTWPSPAGPGGSAGPVALVPAEAAWPGGADQLRLTAPREPGAWVIRLEVADQGLAAAPDIRLTAGRFVAAPARLAGGRIGPGASPEPTTWHGFRSGSIRVVVPASSITPGSGPVAVKIINQDPGWLILRRVEIYPWWWHNSGIRLRLILGVYIGLTALLLWPLGRTGGVAALQAGSWLSATGVALSIWQWGRRLIILDVTWGVPSLVLCLLIWGVGQALSLGQMGTFWGAGPAWAMGQVAALFRRPKTAG